MNYASNLINNKYNWLVIILLGVLGLGFHNIQNQQLIHGGDIAMIKSLWLGCALYYWFAFPLLIITSGNMPDHIKRAHRIFFINMLIRACIELIMMYQGHNWHPMYGISHNIVTIFILAYLYYSLPNERRHSYGNHLKFLITMFLFESYFAYYILELSQGEQIYFVPNQPEHQLVLGITWIAVIWSISHYFFNLRKWSNESP